LSPICIYVQHHEIAAVLLTCKSINQQSINNFIFVRHNYFAYNIITV